MSHDIQAAWVTAELAQKTKNAPADVFADTRSTTMTAYASKESRVEWPIADGVVSIEEDGGSYAIAVEYKRENEGLHGVLTALGQAHAYLKKGYAGAIIVIPYKYESHLSPGTHLDSIIEYTSPNVPIGVFTYEAPDTALASPFKDKMNTIRRINLSASSLVGRTSTPTPARTETQWAHLREGSSDADTFYKYLLTAKMRSGSMPATSFSPIIPRNILEAIQRVSPGSDPVKYLSNSTGISPQDSIWEIFWFKYILTDVALPPWTVSNGVYIVNGTASNIILPDGASKLFFVGRTDSIKNRLVAQLNKGEISEGNASEEYVTNVRARAHSYREDIDSGLEHLAMIENDGRPTALGYRYVDACERHEDANTGLPKALLGSILIKNGQLGAFLHYIYRLSENIFKNDPLAFTSQENENIKFLKQEYLNQIEDEMANNLQVMRKVSARGGTPRQPFQAELAILRNYNYVDGFRVGVGLQINWPSIQEALEFPISETI